MHGTRALREDREKTEANWKTTSEDPTQDRAMGMNVGKTAASRGELNENVLC